MGDFPGLAKMRAKWLNWVQGLSIRDFERKPVVGEIAVKMIR